MGKQINFAHVNEHGSFPALLNHHNLEFTQRGSTIRLLCPFHDDKTPSLGITLEATDKAKANTYHCFGCGAKGSLIDFEKEMSGVDLRTAAETVATVSNCALTPGRAVRRVVRGSESRSKANKGGKRPLSRTTPLDGQDGAPTAREEVSDCNPPLTFSLTLDHEANAVLRRLDLEAAQHYGVGVAKRGGMAGRICIPIHNAKGEIVAYVGRWPDDDVPDEEDKYRFPKGFNKLLELFNLHRLDGSQHVVAVEGFFSAMRLDQLGVPVVALMGTSISEAQALLLKRAGVKSVLVLLDGDEPGRTAGPVVAAQLVRHLFVRLAELPDGTAPDEASVELLQAALPFPLRNRL